MNRREFIGGIGGTVAASAWTAWGLDSRKPRFVAGLITDSHVGKDRRSCAAVEAAWRLFARTRVDMVVNVGDIADHHYPTGYAAYRGAVDEIRAATPGWNPRELYVYAWHDAYDYKGDIDRSVPKYREAFADVVKLLGSNEPIAETEIGGSPVIVVPQMLDASERRRYEEMVKRAVSEHPNRPVFVFDHIPPFDTVCGSRSAGDPWRRKLFDRYPTVIDICGHVHGSLADERLIWQGGFSVVNCGCMAGWGGSLVGNAVPGRRSNGAIIMEVYDDRVVFRRFADVFNPVEYQPQTPWTIDLPYVQKKARYLPARRSVEEIAPSFDAGSVPSVLALGTPMKNFRVRFPAASGVVFQYRIEVDRRTADGDWSRMLRRDVWGEFDKSPEKRARQFVHEIPASYFEAATDYRFRVVPVGFFGKVGGEISALARSADRLEVMSGSLVYWLDRRAQPLKVVLGWNGEPAKYAVDENGVYSLPCGCKRLLLPASVFAGPKGMRFRCVLDYHLTGDPRDNSHVGLACARPLSYKGRVLTPNGDSGVLRNVIEFAKLSDSETCDLTVEGNECRFEIIGLKVYRC